MGKFGECTETSLKEIRNKKQKKDESIQLELFSVHLGKSPQTPTANAEWK